MRHRLLIIGFWIVLMLGGVFIVGTTMRNERSEPKATDIHSDLLSSIPAERGVFSQSDNALLYQNMPNGSRSLDSYYDNRAYPGAPPSIPHPLLSEKGIGGKTCLQCHQNGGYVSQFQAFAPVTPHPEMENCKQCHIPLKTNNLFQNSNWEKIKPPSIRQAAMQGAPPMIPHDLQMRENCLACHAGAAAPKEIRVSHPERINCRQCHLPKNSLDLFVKPPPEKEVFTRPNNAIGESESNLNDAEVSQISSWINKNSLHE